MMAMLRLPEDFRGILSTCCGVPEDCQREGSHSKLAPSANEVKPPRFSPAMRSIRSFVHDGDLLYSLRDIYRNSACHGARDAYMISSR